MKLAASRDGKRQAEYQNHRMLPRCACDGQHVVERHRDVGEGDLPYGLAKRLLMNGRDGGIHRPCGRQILKCRLMLVM